MSDTPASDASTSSRPEAALLIGALGIIYVWALVDRFLLALLVDPIKASLHLTDVEVSLVVGTAFSVFYGLLSLPAGFLSDRLGRRGIVGGAALGWSAATAFCGFATSFAWMFVGRCGVGVAEAFITPASLSLIRDRVDARFRGRAYSIFAMGPNVGGAIALAGGGALLGAAEAGKLSGLPWIGAMASWQIVLILVGVAGVVPIIPLLFVRPDAALRRAHLAGGQGWSTAGLGRHLRANAAAYALLIGYVTTSAMLAFGVNGWMPAMINRKFAMPLSHLGLISGPISLVAAVGGLTTCGALIDRINARGGNILWLGVVLEVLAALSAIAMALANEVHIAFAMFGATIFFAGSFYSVGVSELTRLTPAPYMGKVTALYLIFQSSLGGALAPTVVALLAKLFSGPTAIASGLGLHCAIFGALGAGFCALLGRHVRRSARSQEQLNSHA